MTKTEASQITRREIGTVYRVAASRQSGITYGFNIRTPAGTRIAQSGSDYQDARRHRAEAIAERIAELLG